MVQPGFVDRDERLEQRSKAGDPLESVGWSGRIPVDAGERLCFHKKMTGSRRNSDLLAIL